MLWENLIDIDSYARSPVMPFLIVGNEWDKQSPIAAEGKYSDRQAFLLAGLK